MDLDLQGHRGSAGLMPENTIPSFLKAVDLGVNTIEFDVVISADSQVVVSHDPWFRRDICSTPEGDLITSETEMNYKIYDLTYDEISLFDCGSHGNPNHPDQQKIAAPKPLMRDVILEMKQYTRENNLNAVNYSIEIKSRPDWDLTLHPKPDMFVSQVYEELKELNILDRVIIQSFDVRSLQSLKSLDHSVAQALLISRNSEEREKLDDLGHVPDILSPNYSLVTRDMVTRSQELGMKVIPWTVNDLKEMERLIKMGVDGLITDYPNLYHELN
ncbi:MAG: glycerophosphodiester phosphodiesterase family protein [Balneolales bacterium]